MSILKNIFNSLLHHLGIKSDPVLALTSPYELHIPITRECWQKLNRIVEQSGVKDKRELFALSLIVFETLIEHEMNGGKVKMMDQNGVNSEELNLLEYINGKEEDWTSE